MIDPKYTDLPGIAYDQPDIYETNDVPETEESPYYPPVDDNESIEKIYLNASEAFEKFNYKSSGNNDTSNLNNKAKDSLNAKVESETPLEKYQRLKYEITELKNQISAIEETVKDKGKVKSVSDVIKLIDKTEQELDAIDINKFVGRDFASSILDYQDFHFKELESQIQVFKQKGSMQKILDKGRNEVAKLSDASEGLKYKMIYYPEKAKLQEQIRIANLDSRIRNIEDIMGLSDDSGLKYSQTMKSLGVLKVIEAMVAKVSLLNSNHLDMLENKISSLLQKLDSVTQKTLSSHNTEHEKMLSELFQIVKKVENSSEILPKAVDRMVSLSDIHYRAADFTKNLKHLDDLQANVSKALETNLSLLQELQKNFGTNLDILVKDIASVNERLSKLKAK